MARNPQVASAPAIGERLCAFVLERFPFALPLVREAVNSAAGPDIRTSWRHALELALSRLDARDLPDTSPRVGAATRLEQARQALLDACDGFLAREAIAASLTSDERREI